MRSVTATILFHKYLTFSIDGDILHPLKGPMVNQLTPGNLKKYTMNQHALLPFNLRINVSLIGFSISLLVPSTAVLQKYTGIVGVTIYVTIAFLFLLIVHRYVLTRFVSRVTNAQIMGLIAATFILLLVAFLVVYPFANSGVVGRGSDRDEALNIATTRLLEGHYPYYENTYLGNPISPLPGSLLLAVPFVLLGNSAYQNLFWLLAFLFSISAYLKDRRDALLLLWVILALSPIVLQEFVTGGDLLANSLYTFLCVILMVSAVRQPGFNNWGKILLAVFLGISLASRINFIFLLPLIFSALLKNVGWKSAIKYGAITCFTVGLLIAPFYFYDTQGFSPLHTANKLGQFHTILPFSGIILPLVTGIIALILSFRNTNGNLQNLLKNCAIVLAFPVISGTILQSIARHSLDFSFAGFGLSFLFFGAVAYWPLLFENKKSIAV